VINVSKCSGPALSISVNGNNQITNREKRCQVPFSEKRRLAHSASSPVVAHCRLG